MRAVTKTLQEFPLTGKTNLSPSLSLPLVVVGVVVVVVFWCFCCSVVVVFRLVLLW